MTDSQLKPGLTLVATPIGNARDITLRALDALREADVIAAEDTRSARRLMQLHGIGVGERPLLAYHDRNADRALERVLAPAAEGGRVIYVTDAGTPLIADPGFRLTREAVARGIPVSALPGACAAVMALSLSGLPTDRFTFAGFPPPKREARRRWLEDLADAPGTLVLYEAPRRLAESLAAMAEAFGAREAAVARELTKLFEEVRRAPLAELAARYAEEGPPKGEAVVLVGPAPPAPTDGGAVDAALDAALAGGASLRDAARDVAEALGVPRREVYARGLARGGR